MNTTSSHAPLRLMVRDGAIVHTSVDFRKAVGDKYSHVNLAYSHQPVHRSVMKSFKKWHDPLGIGLLSFVTWDHTKAVICNVQKAHE